MKSSIDRRVSTDHQDNSMESQEAISAEYCKHLGLVVMDIDTLSSGILSSSRNRVLAVHLPCQFTGMDTGRHYTGSARFEMRLCGADRF